ncbi:MAG: glycosyltransferase family 9 protein [Candidatus Aminicenantales bacterium]
MNRKDRPKTSLPLPQKILLIRLRRIGDIVMTTPAIAALRRSLPQSSLTYVIEEPFRRLVEGNPDLDEILVLPPHQGIFSFLRFIRRLRRERYDLAIDFHGGPRASRIAWLSRAKLKAGYELKHKGFLYDVRVPRSRQGAPVHSVENHLNLVRAAGVNVEEPLSPLALPPARKEETERIEGLWTDRGFPGAKVVVLHVGAGTEFRDWGLENLAALAGRLAGLQGVRVVLVGAAQDASRAEDIRKTRPAEILSLAGRMNLIELREVISRAALFVGPDSGPMHIAATTRTPIVALFGPTLPAHFAPWKAGATLIEKPLDCRPCKQRRCLTGDFRCLRNITVDEVFAACTRLLREP